MDQGSIGIGIHDLDRPEAGLGLIIRLSRTVHNSFLGNIYLMNQAIEYEKAFTLRY